MSVQALKQTIVIPTLIVAILKDLTPVSAFLDFRVMAETAQVNVYFQSCKYPEHGIELSLQPKCVSHHSWWYSLYKWAFREK